MDTCMVKLAPLWKGTAKVLKVKSNQVEVEDNPNHPETVHMANINAHYRMTTPSSEGRGV